MGGGQSSEFGLAALSRDLRAAAERLDQLGARMAPLSHSGLVDEQLIAAAEWLYRSRRARDEVFPGGLFSEPSWDMVLDLFVASGVGREVSVSSACVASAAPATTALRHLAGLEAAGIVARRSDPGDSRRSLVGLTEEGAARMRAFLLGVLPADPRAT